MHNSPSESGHDRAPRRSANSTLEKLDDALSVLERRMGIPSGDHGPKPHQGVTPRPQNRDDDIAAIRARQETLARRAPHPSTAIGSSSRAHDESFLHSQIAALRDELNREMSTTLSTHFDSIRNDLRSLKSQGADVSPSELSDGFNRLTRELGVVASRVENNDMGSLRSEVEDLKQQVAALAREDTLRDMAERWTVLENEISALPKTLGSRQDLMAIADRIAEINDAMHGLPDSGAMGAMETQMRSLAEAVEHLASQNAAVSPDHLIAIEERLDEISRAIISVSVSATPPEFDTAPFERIEARLSAMARQIEERAGTVQSKDVDNKLMEIGARLDALHEATASRAMPSDAIETVTARLEDLARRFDQETRPEAVVPDRMLDSLNARFEEIAQRLETNHQSAEQSGVRMFESLDARMEELARRIEENERESANVPTLDHMERRIEEIAQMLSSGDAYSPGIAATPNTHALENLEAQIVALSERLSTAAPAQVSPDIAELAPRLIAVSEQLASGREDMIAAARIAAEEAVSHMSSGASEQEKVVLSQLAADLGGLDELARHADNRNVRTFEAIHDTLVKIADRIAGLESSIKTDTAGKPAMPRAPMLNMPGKDEEFEAPAKPASAQAESAPSSKFVDNPPSVDFAHDEDDVPQEEERRDSASRPAMSPAEAAAFAARAALNDRPAIDDLLEPVEAGEQSPEKSQRGLLKGLRSAFSRNGRPSPAKMPAGEEPPATFGKAGENRHEPEFSDEPLEPGSGAPDLAAIMKRVRAERAGEAPDSGPAPADDDAGKSDFIAAARRAARAAAAEASVLDTGKPEKGRARTKTGRGTLSASRRPLLLGAGAILLALLAFPLVRGFLTDKEPARVDVTRMEEAAPAPVAEPVATEPENAVRVIDGEAPGQAVAAARVAEMAAGDEVAAEEEIVPAAMDGMETDAAEGMDAAESETSGDYQAITLADVPETAGPIVLREAAVEGDPKALFLVGENLTGGGPGSPGSDVKAAARWYEMSADLGYALAQYRIGNFYEKGVGVERDLDAAKTWYQLAAEQGNASAMHNLAVLFATEIDGKRDMASAARWFLAAAELGVKDSQVNLGILSARGEGTEQNLVESYKWLALATKAGDPDALTKRDEVAGFMRPDQLEMAKGAVELWKPKQIDLAVNTIDVPDSWRTDSTATAANPLSKDEMKKAVRNIQAILNNNGYDAGPADGVMGDKTRNAILEFQKASGMAPNGEIDRMLVDKLLEINTRT
jgi:localization factor PodJL